METPLPLLLRSATTLQLLLVALWLPQTSSSAAGASRTLLQRGRESLQPDLSQSFLAEGTHEAKTLKARFPWYHTSKELSTEARALQGHCRGALSVRAVSEDGVDIDVATVKAKDSQPNNKVFMIFGEHSRELISPESGLHFLKVLCGGGAEALSVLKDSEFEIVLNGNPRSRRAVESGAFCTRTNPSGVDLNRNWDEMWTKDAEGQNPGPYPFSEPETRIFKRLVTEYKPTTFLTIHSGTRGLYMPWAYDREHLATRNQAVMMQILESVDAKHCECPFGAAGREVGYSCPGTCLDWAYDRLKTPYAFAFEIYTSPEQDGNLRSRWREKLANGGSSLLQAGHHLAHEHFLDFFARHGSDFVQTRHGVEAGGGAQGWQESCFRQFNPDTAELFNATVANWAQAYLQTAVLTSQDLRRNATGAPAVRY